MTRSAPLGNPVPIARRLTVVAVIVAASMLTFSAPASARGRSPVERLDRFAFTFTFTFTVILFRPMVSRSRCEARLFLDA